MMREGASGQEHAGEPDPAGKVAQPTATADLANGEHVDPVEKGQRGDIVKIGGMWPSGSSRLPVVALLCGQGGLRALTHNGQALDGFDPLGRVGTAPDLSDDITFVRSPAAGGSVTPSGVDAGVMPDTTGARADQCTGLITRHTGHAGSRAGPEKQATSDPEDQMTHSIPWEHVTHADVLSAMEEYDRLGPEQFFSKHGFAPTTTYELVSDEHRYPPKAILGTAYELATGQRLASGDFEGGKTGAVKVLGKLGFTVQAIPRSAK